MTLSSSKSFYSSFGNTVAMLSMMQWSDEGDSAAAVVHMPSDDHPDVVAAGSAEESQFRFFREGKDAWTKLFEETSSGRQVPLSSMDVISEEGVIRLLLEARNARGDDEHEGENANESRKTGAIISVLYVMKTWICRMRHRLLPEPLQRFLYIVELSLLLLLHGTSGNPLDGNWFLGRANARDFTASLEYPFPLPHRAARLSCLTGSGVLVCLPLFLFLFLVF